MNRELAGEGFLAYQYRALGIDQHLGDGTVTEICINRPGEAWLERGGRWERHDVPDLTWERARHFCTTVVNGSGTGQRITDSEPMVSLTFPGGQRAQFVIPPACEAGSISITIRLPSRATRTLDAYSEAGFFPQPAQEVEAHGPALDTLLSRGEHVAFFREAVRRRRNIVVSGATGSGKTTFMKTLVATVPDDERLVTIEDARELFVRQPNVVHLLYSKGGQGTAAVTAKSCMEACLRMKPDRIILAELRGDEAFYFVRNCASGHPGSITSCHAGSTAQTWQQLGLMIKASPEGAGLEFATILELLRATIDIVVHVAASGGRRRITGIELARESAP
jgi:type IV secretion system protein VirB11